MSHSASPHTLAPTRWSQALRMIGPGVVLALASVGASDMVTTLNSGAQYGLSLAWVFVVGLVLKYALNESIARLQLTGDKSFLSHLTQFGGRTFPVILLVAELLIGLFFGAGVCSISTLILMALFPGLPFGLAFGAVLASAVVMLWLGRYSLVEKVMVGFAILMFFGIVYLAVTSAGAGDSAAQARQTLVPVLPAHSLVTVLSLIGGVGGATGIMAYTYFVREKGWSGRAWRTMVRTDLAVSYLLIVIFAVAMTAVGAFWLLAGNHKITSNSAVFDVGQILGREIGPVAHGLFLLSFFAVTYSSVLGGFQGIAYVTGDCLRVVRKYPHQDEPGQDMSAKAPEFRAALVWLAVCSVLILQTGKPVTLVLIYSAISSFVLPILSTALLVIMNRSTTPAELRNGWLSNVLLVACLALFGFLCALQLQESITGLT
ncbi:MULTISPECIES: Nramp family divalent metal transporter [unclassified Luteococcus]|uniref:Nramp family divalent metal transporter n=1 Tax=unclassified Luteococcus TaxID=2639923 RepID=UPI00313D911F